MKPEPRLFNRMFICIFTTAVVAGIMAAGCTMGPRPGFAGDRPHGRGHGGPPPPMGTDRKVADLTRELGLSPDQAERIKAIMAAHEEQVHETMEDGRRQMEKNRREMEAMREQVDSQIAQVLTEEQYKRFKEMCEKRRHQGPPPGGPHGPRE